MTDKILDSQRLDKFKAEPVNLINHNDNITLEYESVMDKRYITPNSNESWNSWVEFEIPKTVLCEVYLQTELGGLTAGSYAEYPGLNLIDEVELLSGKNVVERWSYADVMERCLNANPELRTELNELTGGATNMVSGTVLSPLPLFFSRLNSYEKEGADHFDSRGLRNQLRLRLRTRSAAEMVSSGSNAGNPSMSCKLFIHEVITNAPVCMNPYHTMSYQTYEHSNEIVADTETTIDIGSFTGKIKAVWVYDRLVSDVDTDNNRFNHIMGEIDSLKLRMDGRDFWESQSRDEIRLDNMLSNDLYIGDFHISKIPFSIQNSKHHRVGHLNRNHFNKVECILSHSNTANAYVSFLAETECVFVNEDGFLKRVF